MEYGMHFYDIEEQVENGVLEHPAPFTQNMLDFDDAESSDY